jgi:hypothetical protein
VPAEQREPGSGRAGRRAQFERAAVGGERVLGRHLGRVVEAKRDDPPRAGEFPPQRQVGVVGIEHGERVRRQAFDEFAFGARYRRDAAETFQMRRAGVADHTHRRAGDVGQMRDFAAMVHAHLDHRCPVRRAQVEQRQWHAYVIVAVASRGEHRAQARRQRGGQQFLDGGLAAGSGDGDQRQIEAPAPGGGEPTERGQRVGDLQARQRRVGAAHHGAGGTGGGHGGQVVVAVEARAFERHE